MFSFHHRSENPIPGGGRGMSNTMVKGLWFGVLTLFFLIPVPGAVHADQVVMKNGDSLHGKVVSMSHGKLVFKTDYAGQITIKWDQVAGLTTDEPMEIYLRDEKILEGKIATSEQGELVFEPKEGALSAPVTMAQVKTLDRPEPPPAWDYNGNVAAGASKETGNTNTEKYSMTANLKIFKMPDVIKFYGEFHKEWSKQVLSKDNWLGSGTYERFLTKKWFLYANGVAQMDQFKSLDLLANVGAGPGYQFWQSREKNLSIRLGPAYAYEKFTKKMVNYGNVEERDYFAGYWALDFDMWFFERFLQLYHHDDVLYDFQNSGNWVVRTRTGVRIPLILQLFASFQFNYDFDNQPADGKDKYDQSWIFALGWQF